ncbi:hypothetical protein NG54_14400 [Heyndrickxia ginsengihumi]|uniref:Uncharacterized protein n=1 Tax=Heyndrickxia ginsengihumi TaxID=363870 RepID=A0A0A6VAQ8_9BACI|nr:hypothetical protein NG54_14400 [Heyndrickxia ginsengihumi]
MVPDPFYAVVHKRGQALLIEQPVAAYDGGELKFITGLSGYSNYSDCMCIAKRKYIAVMWVYET